MAQEPVTSRISLTIDLDATGRNVGDAMLRWSDNSNPLGYHPIPVISLKGGEGPVIVIIGGTHGDEFEGPAAMMRLAGRLKPDQMQGQVILIPALNAPALVASSRTSPLDGQNLNRAFPGRADGGPTAMLAHFLETEILPGCDAVIDLHSGGKASFFQPSSLPMHSADPELAARNMELAQVFGLPLVWRLGANNDSRSVNSAADRAGVAMIACELGGGGGVDPAITDQTEAGLIRVLRHMRIIGGEIAALPPPRVVETAAHSDSLFASGDGLFDRKISAGQDVKAGDTAGWFHYIGEPERASVRLAFRQDGFVLAHTNRGLVRRGEMLALVTRDVPDVSRGKRPNGAQNAHPAA